MLLQWVLYCTVYGLSTFSVQVMDGCLMLKPGNGEKLNIPIRTNQGCKVFFFIIINSHYSPLSLNNTYFYLRLWHTACPGKDSDVIVFGGSCDYILLVDTVRFKEPCRLLHCIQYEYLHLSSCRVTAMMHLFSRCSHIPFSGETSK